MSKIASELLVQRLIDWYVDTVFGPPGDGINGIVEGLHRHQEDIRFVLVHHEDLAALENPRAGPDPAAVPGTTGR